MKIITEKFLEVLKYEGAVSITTWCNNEAHVTCTWNSYIVLDGDNLMIPAAGMTSTQTDIAVNNRVIITLAARQVEGFNGYKGTGFRVEGTAEFIGSGEKFDMMKTKYPFIRSVLYIHVTSAKQLL